MQSPSSSPPSASPSMSRVVERNIGALAARQEQENQRKKWQDRLADAVTAFTGSMTFVFLHLLLFGLWISWNLGWLGLKPFDPSFVVLAMVASVEAIFLSTFVLISQNRSAAEADKRANLDLQISLLSEHEVMRLLVLVTAIAQKMGIEDAADPAVAELTRDVLLEEVLDALERKPPEHT